MLNRDRIGFAGEAFRRLVAALPNRGLDFRTVLRNPAQDVIDDDR